MSVDDHNGDGDYRTHILQIIKTQSFKVYVINYYLFS
jgi:hypothetical protein